MLGVKDARGRVHIIDKHPQRDVQADYVPSEALVYKVETKLKRKRETASDSVQLDPFRSVFLRANGFQVAVMPRYPQLNVTVGVSEIKFHGLVEDIKAAKLLMFEEFLNKLVSNSGV